MPRNGTGTFSLVAGNPVITGTTISSSAFNALTSDLATALTTSLATDGQTAMGANLPMGGNKITGLGAGTNSTDAATVAQLVPPGVILDYGGASAPAGFLACDGSAVSRTTYAALFTAIGTAWGAGDGSTTFTLPDLRRRTTIGAGGTAVAGPANTLAAVGGEETHALTTAELAAHNHTINITDPTHVHILTDPTHVHPFGAASNIANGGGSPSAFNAGTTGATGAASSGITMANAATGITAASVNAGSGTAHNNMQPSAVVNKIIKT